MTKYILYHGSPYTFDTFQAGIKNGWSNPREGFYFTDDPQAAKEFGDVTRWKVSFENLLNADEDTDKVLDILASADPDYANKALADTEEQYGHVTASALGHRLQEPEFIAAAKKKGYDGMMFVDHLGGPMGLHWMSVVAFHPEQAVKLDDGDKRPATVLYEVAFPQSPKFKRWFKNSKVVNPDGSLKKVYHGLTKSGNFEEFRVPAFFTDSREYALHYCDEDPERLIAVYLDIENPFVIDAQKHELGPDAEELVYDEEFIQDLRSKGHDGVIVLDGDVTDYVVLSPAQIRRVSDDNQKILEAFQSQTRPYPATDEWVRRASNFLFEKWKERAKEYGRDEPASMSGACKFGSMFAQELFGGKLRGHRDHQWLETADGTLIDLTNQFEFEKKHDPTFFGNPEHRASMKTCTPKVKAWVQEFRQEFPVTSTVTEVLAEVRRKLPKFLYHGTSLRQWEKMKQDGYQTKLIYLAGTPSGTEMYQQFATEKDEEDEVPEESIKPVLITFSLEKLLSLGELHPDYDDLTAFEEENISDIMDKKDLWVLDNPYENITWDISLKYLDTCSFSGAFKDAIVSVKVEDGSSNSLLEAYHSPTVRVWHGTTTEFWPTIRSNGLVADPKTKVWSPDTQGGGGERRSGAKSMESYPGIYVTQNFMTAYSASGNAVRKFGGENLLVGGVIQPRAGTVRIDEDHLSDPSYAWGKLDTGIVADWTENTRWIFDFLKGDWKLDLERWAKEWMLSVGVPEAGLEHVQGQAVKTLESWLWLRGTLRGEIEGQTDPVWQNKEFLKFLSEKYGTENYSEWASVADKRYRADNDLLLKQVTKYLQKDETTKYSGSHGSFRLTEDLGFSGANRIDFICAWPYKTEGPYKEVKALYAKNDEAVQEFIKLYSRHIGGTYVVLGPKGNVLYSNVEKYTMKTKKDVSAVRKRWKQLGIPLKKAVNEVSYSDEGFVGEHWGSAASGMLFVSTEGGGPKLLLLRRSEDVEEPGTWGIPGGAVPKAGKKRMDIYDSALKESEEELGFLPEGFKVIDKFVYVSGSFRYTTFVAKTSSDFEPELNWESDDWGWFALDELPRPLHLGVEWLLNKADLDSLKESVARSGEQVMTEAASTDFPSWFGNSVAVNEDGTPRVYYRGIRGPKDYPKSGVFEKPGLEKGRTRIYLTPSDQFAREVAGRDGRVISVYVHVENPFDYENPEHLKQFEEAAGFPMRPDGTYYNFNAQNQSIIMDMGFDGHYERESRTSSTKNLVVFGGDQIRKVSGEPLEEVSKILKEHDYDAGWDYEIDEEVDEGWVSAVNEIKAEIEKDLLPKLLPYNPEEDEFTSIEIAFVKDLDVLGRYINGTWSRPYFVLDMDSIVETADKYGVEIRDGIESTITHELGHAVQEALGKSMSEKQAEAFAHLWWEERAVLPAFKKRDKTKKGKLEEISVPSSPEFKRFTKGSKLTTPEGQPMVMYRGTQQPPDPEDFFKDLKLGRATPSFTEVPEIASLYSHRPGSSDFLGIPTAPMVRDTSVVSAYFITMRNPIDLRPLGTRAPMTEILKPLNYDFGLEYVGDKNVFNLDDLMRLFIELATREMRYMNIDYDLSFTPEEGLTPFGGKEISLVLAANDYINKTARQAISAFQDGDTDTMQATLDEITDLVKALKIDVYVLADSAYYTQVAKRMKYDGIIHKDTIEVAVPYLSLPTVSGGKKASEIVGLDLKADSSHDTYRPFSQTQIKSATGNVGTWSRKKKNIREGNEKILKAFKEED